MRDDQRPDERSEDGRPEERPDDLRPEEQPDGRSASEPVPEPGAPPHGSTPSRSTHPPDGTDEREGFDVPEWVSEFRRLYVEPKSRAAAKEHAARIGRRPAPPPGPGGRAAGAAAGRADHLDQPERPMADEPLRSRSAVQRDRRTAGTERPRHPEPSAPARRTAESDSTGPGAAGSRAALRRARQERARAERRMRLRRTVVLGVLVLVVAAVVTWLVARNQEPVSATPAALAVPPPAQGPGPLTAATAADATDVDPMGAGAGTAADAAVPGAGGEANPVRRQALKAIAAAAEPGPPAQVTHLRERAASTAAAPTPAPSSTPRPVARGTGSFTWVDWGRVPDVRTSGGDPERVALEVEGGLGLDEAATARAVSRILVDERGWQTARDVRFVFVGPEQAERGEFDTRIGIASRETTDELCAPLETDGYTSCYNGRVVINLDRWMLGVEAYDGRLDDYRTYVVSHEVGHALGLGHASCPARGAPAPVMVPQTLHLWGCLPNPYPVVG